MKKGSHHTEESKQNLREANLGEQLSKEHKQHLRDSSPHLSGENHPMYGKHHTKEAKEKIREGNLGEKNHNYGKKGEKSHMYGKVNGENNPSWKGGISFEPYCIKFGFALKERVREFFGRKCYVCGKTEEENGQRLSVHHVNYDKMVCCNDIKPLFVPLCKGHHSMTNIDREEWGEFFSVSLEYLTQGECFIPKEMK